MQEKIKDFLYGAATIAALIGIIAGSYELGEMVGLSRETVWYATLVPFFIYFSYVFGGLTRSILKSKKS